MASKQKTGAGADGESFAPEDLELESRTASPVMLSRLEAVRAAIGQAAMHALDAQTRPKNPVAVSHAPEPDPEQQHFVHLHALRAFSFIYPGNQAADETLSYLPGDTRAFAKGNHVLDRRKSNDQFFLSHPWIKEHLADGAIEHPQKTLERLKTVHEESRVKAAQTQAAIADAEAGIRRHAMQTLKTQEQMDAFLTEMHTPINQQRRVP